MPRIGTASLQSLTNAPLGPGGVVVNMPNVTPQRIEDALGGDLTAGRVLGAMTSSPSVSVSHETQDLTENLVGINARLKGATQLQRSDVSLSVDLAEITHENIPLLDPTLDAVDWLNSGTKASLTLGGTGNSAFTVTAKADGTAGNAVRIALINPSVANAVLSVAVSGNDITVNLGNGATAGTINSTALQVRDAINASAAAAALVTASLPGTSNGSGIVTAAAMASLTGGVNGTAAGKTYRNRGYVQLSNYFDNVVAVFESLETRVFFAIEVRNCISLSDTDWSFDDEGNVAGITLELQGHSGEGDTDPLTGATLSPYLIHRLNNPVAA